ncbi:MAG TPA: glycosyltransferase [Candidatus Saccharimonadaceae bacterium]|nr:glycosyltransferase [Candidatus Saccharimonadaceae bacterium]
MSAGLPSVSVIVVTRDRPQLLADALASVAAQRLEPREVRIANDGVIPVTEAAAELEALEVVLLECDCAHAAGARNAAARGAHGDVLAFLDDDDVWRPEHLEGLAQAFVNPDVALAYRDAVVMREILESRGARVELERRLIAREWDPEWMRHDDYIPPSALAVRRTLFTELGGFDESFRFSEDWDFLLRAARVTQPRRVAGVTVEVRMRHAGHASHERGPERRECLDRLAERHGLPPLEIKTFWEVAEALGAAQAGS